MNNVFLMQVSHPYTIREKEKIHKNELSDYSYVLIFENTLASTHTHLQQSL